MNVKVEVVKRINLPGGSPKLGSIVDLHESVAKEYLRTGAVISVQVKEKSSAPFVAAGMLSPASPAVQASVAKTSKQSATGASKTKKKSEGQSS